MKKYFIPVVLIFCIAAHAQVAVPPLPAKKQLDWQNKPFYLFMHFGPNTFTDLEWGQGSEKEEVFNPASLDCRQWCRIAKAAGATGIVITAKHHDGFCLWPSQFSSHTVAQSSWRNGKGDVLKELQLACKEYGLSMGVYLSPWDRNHPAYGTPAYNDIFVHMMEEVVRNYGPFFEFWWDGANGEGPNGKKQVYDWNRFEKTIRSIAPNTMVFSDIGPDLRWVGNENGVVGSTNWNLLDTAGFSRGLGAPPNDTLNQGNVNGKIWLPAECDVSIRPGWFYHVKEDSLVKSPEQLFNIYLKSVGRGANLILNVPPDPRGLISLYDSSALMGFARLRAAAFAENLLEHNGKVNMLMKTDPFSSVVDIRLDHSKVVNCLQLGEKLVWGQHVKSFSVTLYNGKTVLLKKEYTTVGRRRIITFPRQTADRVEIDITESKASPELKDIGLFLIPDNLLEK